MKIVLLKSIVENNEKIRSFLNQNYKREMDLGVRCIIRGKPCMGEQWFGGRESRVSGQIDHVSGRVPGPWEIKHCLLRGACVAEESLTLLFTSNHFASWRQSLNLLKQKWSRGWDKAREGKEGARPLTVIWVPHSTVWLLQGVCTTTVGTRTLLSVKRIRKDFPRCWKIASSQIGKSLTS